MGFTLSWLIMAVPTSCSSSASVERNAFKNTSLGIQTMKGEHSCCVCARSTQPSAFWFCLFAFLPWVWARYMHLITFVHFVVLQMWTPCSRLVLLCTHFWDACFGIFVQLSMFVYGHLHANCFFMGDLIPNLSYFFGPVKLPVCMLWGLMLSVVCVPLCVF